MLQRVSAVWELLRPRSLASTRKTLDDLVSELRDMKRVQQETARELREQLSTLAVRESQLRAVYVADADQETAMGQLATVLDDSRIIAHVTTAIARAPLHLAPFPYCVIPDVLPDDFYDVLLRAIPPVELFADRPLNKQHLTVPLTVAPAFSRRVWKYMAHVVTKAAFQPALVEKFREPLGAWIAANWPSLADDPLGHPMELKTGIGRILVRGRGYRIPPHRDPKWGFLTVILYLARPQDSETWGTQLYEVGGDHEAVGAAPHWIDGERCHGEVDVPFRPNTALVFINSTGAHGAHIPEDAEPADLRRYVLQFHIGPSATALRALQSLLPEERRALWAGKRTD
jgi:hypothetical protein